MLINKESFSNLYELVSEAQKSNPFWDQNTAFGSDEFISAYFVNVATAITDTSGEEKGPEEFASKTYALLSDLISLKATNVIPEELCNMLQFSHSTDVFISFLGQKRFSEANTWLFNSIADEVLENANEGIERTYSTDRILQLFTSENPCILYILSQIQAEWIEGAFYFSRSSGSVFDLAKHLLPLALGVFTKLSNPDIILSTVKSEIQVLAWCTQFGFGSEEKQFSEHLLHVYESNNDLVVKKVIAFQFAVGNSSFTGLSKKQWCETVKDNFWDMLIQHEKFQILANKHVELDDILDHFDDLVKEVKLFDFDAADKDYITTNYHVNSIFNILRPPINILSSAGKISEANSLIGAYFSIPEEELIEPDNMIIIPNITEYIYYCFQGDVIIQKCDDDAIKEIIKTRNGFLSLTQTLRNDIEFEPDVPRIIGKPIIKDAHLYLKALRSHFHIEHLKSCNLGNSGGYFVSYETNLHIQNIISLDLGITLPMLRNLKKTKPARPIKSVFIWEGGTFSTELARKGLQGIFGSKGIAVNWRDFNTSDKADFLSEFESNDYDIFWVLGHGNFEHFQPHNSSLDLAENVLVDINELLTKNYKGDERRLLVMDICDGSTTFFNGPRSIGIGASLTGPTQSLVGYSWMIENMASLILGLLLASFLSEQLAYTEAHQKTIAKFYEGKDAVLDHLEMYVADEDVLERVRNYDIDFRNFYYWGALAYLQ